ncbi:hypothetical protein IWQ56_001099 [Coemansia nantahalensis]|uniref:Uncharacterized protein n=2 Tax=Coemansia TaxID=4863 RepID=A0ACC1L345_9FUNG|nr:hypothetical protein IWQ57_002300 [Coemansia nantahalensis]KAJ2773145.1 hypothetical protein IWQ56_001099 [Coemansia nantahalensis]KAJ2799475.1 hypothetical protein H4R21_003532 [Coemansia helicoidea]
MESAFARLFRASKLASCDGSIKQIYTTYAREAPRREWGLKRPMPSKLSTRLATIACQDTREQIIDLESANQQYMLAEAWKENFTESYAPGSARPRAAAHHHYSYHQSDDGLGADDKAQASRGPQRNLCQMTRAEWNRFLAEARSRRAEWRQALEKNIYAPQETLAFMNATNVATNVADGVHRQPTYHDSAPPSEALRVHGRVLNRVGSGYAVAVQGIIANLPLQTHALEAGFQFRDVKTFYVHSATFDSQGRPRVTLGVAPLGARAPAGSFSTNSPGSSSTVRSWGSGSRAQQDKYLARIQDAMQLVKQIGGKPADGAGGPEGGANPVTHVADLLNKSRR